MSNPRDPLVFINRIIDSIEYIKIYISDIDFDTFESSYEKQDAVNMRLQIIGENVSELPDVIFEKYPEIQWRSIIGLRHIISHAYEEIIPKQIWNTIGNDIPPLSKVMLEIKIEFEKIQ